MDVLLVHDMVVILKGGGVHPKFFVLLDFEIGVEQKSRTHGQPTF